MTSLCARRLTSSHQMRHAKRIAWRDTLPEILASRSSRLFGRRLSETSLPDLIICFRSIASNEKLSTSWKNLFLFNFQNWFWLQVLEISGNLCRAQSLDLLPESGSSHCAGMVANFGFKEVLLRETRIGKTKFSILNFSEIIFGIQFLASTLGKRQGWSVER